MVCEILICSSIIVLILFIWHLVYSIRRKQRYFENENIPGPSPTFLLGNLKDLWSKSQYFRQLQVWTQKYGKVYGMFEGTTPIYVVSDVGFLEQVFIKQFKNFEQRKPLLFLLPGQEKRISLFDANGPTWKRQRHVLNPAFSKAKLLQMLPLLNGCASELIEALKIHTERNSDVDVGPIYFRMSMDAIRKFPSCNTDLWRD